MLGNRALVDADAKDVLANANCVGANAVLSGCRDGLDAKRVGADAILSGCGDGLDASRVGGDS